MGVTMLSEWIAAPLVTRGLLERVLPRWQLPSTTVWAVTAGRRLMPARVTAFVEMFAQVLAELCTAHHEPGPVPAPLSLSVGSH